MAILTAFTGRKKLSSSTVTRAGTAMRGASKTAKEGQDVVRAEEGAEVLAQRLKDLQAEIAAETAKLDAAADPASIALEPVKVAPRKGDIVAGPVALLWVPVARASGRQRRAGGLIAPSASAPSVLRNPFRSNRRQLTTVVPERIRRNGFVGSRTEFIRLPSGCALPSARSVPRRIRRFVTPASSLVLPGPCGYAAHRPSSPRTLGLRPDSVGAARRGLIDRSESWASWHDRGGTFEGPTAGSCEVGSSSSWPSP